LTTANVSANVDPDMTPLEPAPGIVLRSIDILRVADASFARRTANRAAAGIDGLSPWPRKGCGRAAAAYRSPVGLATRRDVGVVLWPGVTAN
jgi:hypothetical protein